MPNFDGGSDSGGGAGITREQVQNDMIFDSAGNLVLHGAGQILFTLPQ